MDWFKYGDGKYVWNIAVSVIGTVVAVGGAIAAICAIPFTGGATIPIVVGCIGAAAATIGAIITTANSTWKVRSNAKAVKLSGNLFDDDDGDSGAARYYGNVSTISQWWAKTDKGDAETNTEFEDIGKIIDRTKVVADMTALVFSVASLGYVRDLRYKKITIKKSSVKPNGKGGYSFTRENIIKNIKADMGIKVSKNVKNGIFKKEAFKTDIFESGYTVKEKFTLMWKDKSGIVKSWSAPEELVKVFKSGKVTKNILDNQDNLSNVNNYLNTLKHESGDTWKMITSSFGLSSNIKILKPLNEYFSETGNKYIDIRSLITN